MALARDRVKRTIWHPAASSSTASVMRHAGAPTPRGVGRIHWAPRHGRCGRANYCYVSIYTVGLPPKTKLNVLGSHRALISLLSFSIAAAAHRDMRLAVEGRRLLVLGLVIETWWTLLPRRHKSHSSLGWSRRASGRAHHETHQSSEATARVEPLAYRSPRRYRYNLLNLVPGRTYETALNLVRP
eukprot:SAG31_NODE_3739_length_3932_cov_3.343245_3_plen_185_part_00